MARALTHLCDHLAPDTVRQLQRAARERYDDATRLVSQGRNLGALYLFGHSAEMCLLAASFRCAGFSPNSRIDRDTRRRRMAQARQLRDATGEPLMNADPHPVVGWARFLQWQRSASGNLSAQQAQKLREALNKARIVYNHWRPELRYKTAEVRPEQLDEVRRAAFWLLNNQDRL